MKVKDQWVLMDLSEAEYATNKGTWSVWRFELRPPIAPPIAETLFFAVHVAMVHIIDDVGSMHARTAL